MMTIFVDSKSVVFCGKVKELKTLFAGFEGDTKLKEFIHLHLN